MKGLLQKLRNATDQIESLVFKDVYQRMARFLTLNAATHDDERVVDGIYTQQQIADILGSSREMVSRVYKELIDGHYIAVKGKRIVIKKDLPYSW
jgi:CRP/FNR family cyclic AMP-dependent transcriptional regulator